VFFIIIAKPRISSVAEVVRAKPCNFLLRCFSSTAVAAKPVINRLLAIPLGGGPINGQRHDVH